MTSVVSGYLSGVSLFGLLQLLHLERKTCLLNVGAGARSGELTLVDGELVDAHAGEAEGETAVHQILAWADPRVTFGDAVAIPAGGISTPLTQLLFDAVRLQDEDSIASLAFDAAIWPPHDEATDPNEPPWLAEAFTIAGALAVALVDVTTGEVVAAADIGAAVDLAAAAAGMAAVVRAKLEVITALRVEDAIEDIVFTLSGQYHLIRVLGTAPWRFLYLILERDKANLALARRSLARLSPSP